ncbi:MAG TPA: RDD family protein [Abditibacteriaceae bacterium]|jgi:uncharacterized RDD family membrane protein YckC
MDSPTPLPLECLASPWKRLAASACDCLLILFAHIVFWIFFNALVDSPDAVPDALARRIQLGSSGLCWLYFWVSWSLGTTPGQRLWHIRVVAENGARPGWRRGFVRCLGYMLASIPLKMGLVAAWFHPHRQGWHDRIARTVVVERDAPRAFQLPPFPAATGKAAPPLIDVGAARHGWPLALIACGVLACAMTWPVAAQLSARIAGEGITGDSGVFVWNYWFFRHALLSGTALTSTDLLFYPERVSLLFHTMNWFNCVLAFPLLPVFGSVATYNLLFIFSFASCTFSAYWFCCAFTRNRLASFAAAIPFAFASYFLAHGLGHANLQSAQFIPLFALFYYASLVQPCRRYAVAAAFALALNALCDWQYFLFSLVLGACLFVGVEHFFASDRALFKVRSGSTVLTVALGTILLSPLLFPALLEAGTSRGVDKSGQMAGFSADIANFIAANPMHPRARAEDGMLQINNIEHTVNLGWLALPLALVGFWSVRRRAKSFVLVALVFFLGACGPRLHLFSAAPLSTSMMLAFGGAPGNAFDLPWDNRQLVQASGRAAASPEILLQSSVEMMLPFAWLPRVVPRVVPLLRPFRVVARLAVVVLLCVSLGVAFALARLMRLVHLRGHRHLAWLIPTVAGLLFLAEQWPVPYPSTPVRIPQFYQRLARDSTTRALLEVPVSDAPETMALQTVSGKAIFFGNLARASPNAYRFIQHNIILRKLSPIDYGTPMPKQSLVEARTELLSLGTRYITIRTDKPRAEEHEKFLRNELRLSLIATEGTLRVYKL